MDTRKSMGWSFLAIAVAGLLIVLFACAPFRKDPWMGEGSLESGSYITFVNDTPRPCQAGIMAKDGSVRDFGFVQPGVEVKYKLPFADTKVLVSYCGVKRVIHVDKPEDFKFTARPM